MNPLILALTLTLHANPEPDAPISAYVKATCSSAETPESQENEDGPTTADMRNEADAQVACLKQAMERELDGFLVPLKQKDPKAFKSWMALQADFNRWTTASCDLYERTSGNDGSMAGFAEMACAQDVRAHRAWFAKQLASGDLKPFWSLVEALQPRGQKAAQETLAQLKEAKTSKPEDSENPLLGLEPKELKAFEAKLKETNAATEKLAKGHCKVLPGAPAGCEAKLATYFHAMSRM
ncbi:hypothetical protein HPC49_10160 [Pyxidicoccus fallax]|uniref:Uncharacterized protein n=1 Tax=Pyxidicoccus fallax TaxID=394095 RepID=A0A346D7B9_9BACT|nr:hypothetical protein [Pyxidicoccus fallax]AXM42934.1 hypothetical protein [Pyxidicoccus fallax]NMO18045.1 hypothetical protein [Pyxidicoccus fallax]NPC78605.1 hypothetical protein [Pyxidicoccus fallax]